MNKLTLPLTIALILAVATVAAAGENYNGHIILGKNYDKQAVERMLDESEVPAEVTVNERGVKRLEGKFRLDKSKIVEDAALDFIDQHRNVFKLKDPKKELKFHDIFKQPNGSMDVRYSQLYNGVPIWSKSIRVHISKDKDLDIVDTDSVPTPDIDTSPLLTEDEAVEIAKKDLGISPVARIFPPNKKLVIYHNRLAYEIGIGSFRYFIDAKNGDVIVKENIDDY